LVIAVFHVTIIVVGQNIFQVWNIRTIVPRPVHPIQLLFSTMIARVCFKQKFKSCFKKLHFIEKF